MDVPAVFQEAWSPVGPPRPHPGTSSEPVADTGQTACEVVSVCPSLLPRRYQNQHKEPCTLPTDTGLGIIHR